MALHETTALRCAWMHVQNVRLKQGLQLIGVVLVVFGAPLAGLIFGLAGLIAAFAAPVLVLTLAGHVTTFEREAGTLILESGGLRFVSSMDEPDTVFARSSITSGYTTENERNAVLRTSDGRQVELALSRDEPARVLEHIGVGTTQRALTLPLRGELGAFTIGFIAFWPLLFTWMAIENGVGPRGEVGFLLALLAAAVSTAIFVARFGFPSVVVGADGVRILGVRRRFFPYARLERVALVAATHPSGSPKVRMVLTDGSEIPLPTIAAPRERVEGLAMRIRDAARSHAEGAARRLDALGRGGRSVTAWRSELERMALAPPGFRDHALGRDDFERVLGDASARPDERIGAALALRAIDPTTATPRIRIAADACADDALRDALATAADGEIDDALLERASAGRVR